MPTSNIGSLNELAADLMKKSASLNAQINPKTAASVKELLRSMNSYYSNLIEGQNTHPTSIDNALKKNFETDPKKRDLQRLALAHIETQKNAEAKLISDPKTNVTGIEFVKWLHKEFYKQLPDSFLEIKVKGNTINLIPGELREHEVEVGIHIPPHWKKISEFLNRFNEAYSGALDPLQRIIAVAAAHHRIAWVHPFLDGNGRVMRLLSDCMFLREGLGGFGLWTISRGLARHRNTYYEMLALADHTRKNDYDGRGALSDQSLSEFCIFFLKTALDQVEFMSQMLNLESFEKRLKRYVDLFVDEFGLREESFYLLRDLFLRGSIERGDAGRIMSLHERIARDVVSDLAEMGVVRSETPKSELLLHFNSFFAYQMFPSLFPESIEIPLTTIKRS